VFLDEVRLPLSAVVGTVGGGAPMVFSMLALERICIAAQGCGMAQGAYEIALQYARERRQFGKPIIEFQAVGHMLADMAADLEMARLLTWRAAWRQSLGTGTPGEAAMAKVAGSEAGTRCAQRGMQVLGGYSYMTEYGMERYYRESKLFEIVGGTNQILRTMIARGLAGSSTGTRSEPSVGSAL
jgi:alkylation response protein AidB-like acyl-CoA dehydrogenase